MAFLGPIIRGVAGVFEKYGNLEKIEELEKKAGIDLLDGFSEEEKIDANLKIKQLDILLQSDGKKRRSDISKLEREVIDLMEAKLRIKQEELRSQQATQLDIANAMIAIQKLNNEVKDNLHRIDKRHAENTNEIKKRADSVNAEIKRLITAANDEVLPLKNQTDLESAKKELHIVKTDIVELRNASRSTKTAINTLQTVSSKSLSDIKDLRDKVEILESAKQRTIMEIREIHKVLTYLKDGVDSNKRKNERVQIKAEGNEQYLLRLESELKKHKVWNRVAITGLIALSGGVSYWLHTLIV